MRRRPVTARTKFAVADELTCYYDRPAEPANVHVEAQLAAPLDESAVRAAVAAVLAAEPGLRVRRAATGSWRSSYYWEFPPVIDLDPVEVVSYADDAELDRHRAAFLSRSPSLATSPPVRFLLGGDVLMLNAHHACFDGLSALRLLRRVAAEYSELTRVGGGRSMIVETFDGYNTRSFHNHGVPAGGEIPLATPASRETPAAPPPGKSTGRVVRIAGDADRRAPGYGTVQLTWDGLTAVTGVLRAAGYSVNDLLIAALIVTIGEWNAARGGSSGLIKITMPVGDPVQATEQGEWANRSRLTKVTARPAAVDTAAGLLSEVAAQTRYAKNHDSGQVDVLSAALALAPVPVSVKGITLRAMLRVAGPICCDTSLISNLGVVTPVRFGTAGDAYVWFSTSAHLPRGLSVGAVTTDGKLRLTFRYRRALLTGAAAAEFAASYRLALDAVLDGAAVAAAVPE